MFFRTDWLDLLAVHETLTKELESISGKLAMEAREPRHLRVGAEGL